MGGENRCGRGQGLEVMGSSPRGRGKPSVALAFFFIPGLIPAWAGKTFYVFVCLVAHRAHPRVGGENQIIQLDEDTLPGSSPRGRGKRAANIIKDTHSGLIPAWAGKTQGIPIHRDVPSAHPRVGGENSGINASQAAIAGSSPRGRGKHPRPSSPPNWGGLIPAWAGKTLWERVLGGAAWAHPRVGGENDFDTGRLAGVLGSSPRGRGKQKR